MEAQSHYVIFFLKVHLNLDFAQNFARETKTVFKADMAHGLLCCSLCSTVAVLVLDSRTLRHKSFSLYTTAYKNRASLYPVTTLI